MSKWKLRGCPRCQGDIYVERDNDDSYERCLQCGYVKQISIAYGNLGIPVKEDAPSVVEDKQTIINSVF